MLIVIDLFMLLYLEIDYNRPYKFRVALLFRVPPASVR